MLPIIVSQLPFSNNELAQFKNDQPSEAIEPSKKQVSYTIEPVSAKAKSPEILFYYTHSHEAYKPIVERASGKQAVYHEQTNIYTMQDAVLNYFQLNGLAGHVLDVDVMSEMKKRNAPFYQAYQVARPFVQEELSKNMYDLVIDFHRDSSKKDVTTLKHGDMTFAKVVFVVGLEHTGYKENLAYTNTLHQKMNELIPGISRGVLQKGGKGVDGVYNQDLFKKLLLIELGGIDNTEEEVHRTLAVLAQAISKTFTNEQL